MKIVRVNPLIRNLPPEIVTLSNHLPPFHAPSCHPHTETMRVMIAPGTRVIVFMEDDDWYRADHLERVVEALTSRPRAR